MADEREKTTINVRDVDAQVWREIKAAAAIRGDHLKDLLGEILQEWLDRQKG